MKKLKTIKSIACRFSALLLAILVACLFVVRSYAYDVSDFYLALSYYDVEDNFYSQYKNSYMIAGISYDAYWSDEWRVTVSVDCASDTGLGYIDYPFARTYFIASDTTLYYDFYLSFDFEHATYSEPRPYWQYSSGTSNIYVQLVVFYEDNSTYDFSDTMSIKYAGSTVTSTGLPSYQISGGLNLAPVSQGKNIQVVKIFVYADNLYMPSYQPVYFTFNHWQIGKYIVATTDRGNLDEVEAGQAAVDSMKASLSGVSGVGSNPSADYSNIFSGDEFKSFLALANGFYNLPVVSVMTGVTTSFAILFFLLKKRG